MKKGILLILAMMVISCNSSNKEASDFAKTKQREIESFKKQNGYYPKTIEGNLCDKPAIQSIKSNDFFYIFDSTQNFYTLKVFAEDGYSDMFDSRKKQWIHTDK